MTHEQAKQFSRYVVYEMVNEEIAYICLCKDFYVAEKLIRVLAAQDKDNDAYYFTGINEPGDFLPGGGWYYAAQKKDGVVAEWSLE